MYKAVHRQSGEEVLTLHPAWRGRMDELRRLTAEGLLVCQGCRQAVRLKAGPRKRPHFAHRHLQGCSYGQESARILSGRALLYDWLADMSPVQVEAEVVLPGLPRPADLVVRANSSESGGVVYWLVDALMKQETRGALRAAFEAGGLRPVWVLLSNLLHPDANHPAWIDLSPSERDCMRRTPYDQIGHENRLVDGDLGFSLHYLDLETAHMITYRSLERVHAPNVYAGRREECELKNVRIDSSGDPVHPGEERDLTASRGARLRQVERVRRWLEPAPRPKQPAMFPPARKSIHPEATDNLNLSLEAASSGAKVTCIYCGELTGDWWAAWSDGEKRLGKCRGCLDKGMG